MDFVLFVGGNASDSIPIQVMFIKKNATETEKNMLHRIEQLNVPYTIRMLYHQPSLSSNHIAFPRLKRLSAYPDLMLVSQRIKQLLMALNHLHQAQLVHLDVTLANLLCDPSNDDLILIDFGLTHHIDSPSECIVEKRGCGTPGYVAPELISQALVSSAADVYSAGICFGQWLEPFIPNCQLMLLGGMLTTSETTERIRLTMLSHLNENQDHPTLSDGPMVIQHAADLLIRMLHPDPYKRISASDALHHPFVNSSSNAFMGTEYHRFSSLLCKARCGVMIHRDATRQLWQGLK